MIGIDVLAKQREFDRALSDKVARFLKHRRDGALILGAARIGHDTEGAELVAAFLDRQEG